MKKSSLLVLIGLLTNCGCAHKAPDFQVSEVEDPAQTVQLSTLKGHVVVLDFWATWCGPCKMTMPVVAGLYDKYHSKGVRFMGISDETRDAVRQFRAENSVAYPLFLDTSQAAERAFDVSSIPLLVVIDKSGNIAYTEGGAPLDDTKVTLAIDAALAG